MEPQTKEIPSIPLGLMPLRDFDHLSDFKPSRTPKIALVDHLVYWTIVILLVPVVVLMGGRALLQITSAGFVPTYVLVGVIGYLMYLGASAAYALATRATLTAQVLNEYGGWFKAAQAAHLLAKYEAHARNPFENKALRRQELEMELYNLKRLRTAA